MKTHLRQTRRLLTVVPTLQRNHPTPDLSHPMGERGPAAGSGEGRFQLRPCRLQDLAPGTASRGFTLIEIMVVVVILGILAATIIPQFIGTTHDAKVSAAKAHVAELESALERFNVHMDRYPTTDEGLKALTEPPAGAENKWRGPYIKQLRNDPWGNPYQYVYPGTHHPTSFDLWSRGADGQDGGEGENADIGNW